MAALQAEQRELLAVNERLRRALQDAGLAGSSCSGSSSGASPTDAATPPVHTLARAFWLRLRQSERTCGTVRGLIVAVHASMAAARAQLGGEEGGVALDVAQRLLLRYDQAASTHDSGSAGGGDALYRSVVLPNTDTHGALGPGEYAARQPAHHLKP